MFINAKRVVSGSARTFTFRVSLNTLPTLATLVLFVYIFRYLSEIFFRIVTTQKLKSKVYVISVEE